MKVPAFTQETQTSWELSRLSPSPQHCPLLTAGQHSHECAKSWLSGTQGPSGIQITVSRGERARDIQMRNTQGSNQLFPAQILTITDHCLFSDQTTKVIKIHQYAENNPCIPQVLSDSSIYKMYLNGMKYSMIQGDKLHIRKRKLT